MKKAYLHYLTILFLLIPVFLVIGIYGYDYSLVNCLDFSIGYLVGSVPMAGIMVIVEDQARKYNKRKGKR